MPYVLTIMVSIEILSSSTDTRAIQSWKLIQKHEAQLTSRSGHLWRDLSCYTIGNSALLQDVVSSFSDESRTPASSQTLILGNLTQGSERHTCIICI